jgi:uncharacterized membrane protein
MALPLLGLGMLAGRLGLSFGLRRAAVLGAEAVATRAAAPAAELAAAAAARGTSVATMAGQGAARIATTGAEAAAGAAVAGAEVAASAAPSLLARTASSVATTGTVAVGAGHVANQAVRAPFEGIAQVIGKVGETVGQYALPIAAITGAALAVVAVKDWLLAPAKAEPVIHEARPLVSNILHEGRLMAPAVLRTV